MRDAEVQVCRVFVLGLCRVVVLDLPGVVVGFLVCLGFAAECSAAESDHQAQADCRPLSVGQEATFARRHVQIRSGSQGHIDQVALYGVLSDVSGALEAADVLLDQFQDLSAMYCEHYSDGWDWLHQVSSDAHRTFMHFVVNRPNISKSWAFAMTIIDLSNVPASSESRISCKKRTITSSVASSFACL